MKKFFLITAAALFVGAFTTQKAQAQNYPSRIIGVCPTTHQNVYAYYRPVNYNGCVQYMWVPAYHTPVRSNCNSYSYGHRSHSHSYSRRVITNYRPRISVPYVVPNYGYRHYNNCSPRYTGYVRPGFSITISR